MCGSASLWYSADYRHVADDSCTSLSVSGGVTGTWEAAASSAESRRARVGRAVHDH